MAGDGSMQKIMARQMVKHSPSDFMVATFGDSGSALGAYKALKSLGKEGRFKLDSAVVLDRGPEGKLHVRGASLPMWAWAVFGLAGLVIAGVFGLAVTLIVRAISRRGAET